MLRSGSHIIFKSFLMPLFINEQNKVKQNNKRCVDSTKVYLKAVSYVFFIRNLAQCLVPKAS